MSSPEPIVFVVDDDKAARDSLRWLLTSVNLATKTFASAREFLDAYRSEQPGCLVVDVRMPEMSGLELQKELAERSVDLPVIIITGYGEIEMAVRAMKDGAYDFLQKPFADHVLLELVHKAIQENLEVVRERARRAEIQHRLDLLTVRERQVLEGMVTGKTNRQIASQLSLSEKTIEFHRAKIMEKMQVESFADLIRIVMTADAS